MLGFIRLNLFLLCAFACNSLRKFGLCVCLAGFAKWVTIRMAVFECCGRKNKINAIASHRTDNGASNLSIRFFKL